MVIIAAETDIINNVYKYPIYPGDSQWAEYDARELTQMLQLPEELLNGLTTEELVKVVADYPYLSDVFYYDSYTAGFEAVRQNFNGLDELMKRKDASDCLIEYYKKINFANRVDLSNPKSVIRASNYNAVEVVLAQPAVVRATSDVKAAELKEIVEKNVQYRINNSNNSFFISSNCYFKTLQENQLLPKNYSSTVKTPKGTVVNVIIISDEWSVNEKLYKRAVILSEYPNVTILNDASKKYNCHAYAWASRTDVWMDEPSAYWEDGSYIRIGDSVTSYTQKVTYPNVGIAGISHTAHSSSYDGSVMWSKWGSSCLVEHSLYDCPYGRVMTVPYTISVYKRA